MIAQKLYRNKSFVLLGCLLVLLLACSEQDKKKNADVSNIQIHLNSFRFDKALFACDTNNLEASIDSLGNLYPDFSNVFFKEITGFSRGDDKQIFLNSVKHFLTYKDYRKLYDTVQLVFPDADALDAQLKKLFQYVKYYFPEQKLGTIYYFISGLNQWSAVTVDTALAIGLDMHLGSDYPFYPSVQIPEYEIRRCTREYIPVNAAKVIYENMYPFSPDGKTLLDMMLLKGKQLLFTEYVLPETDMTYLIGYTKEQLKWCEANEALIWNYFTTQKFLYSGNWQEVLRYVLDGPNSTGMPPESPGNIGTWIGWRILQNYMAKNPKAGLTDILNSKLSSQEILQASGYRPR